MPCPVIILFTGSRSRLPSSSAIGSSGGPNVSKYNLNIHRLDEVVQGLYRAGLSAASHKTYQVAQRRYLEFCIDFALTPLPASENVLCYFVACLGPQGLAHSSIQMYLSGIRQLSISYGFNDLEINRMLHLCQVLRGVKVEWGKLGKAPRAQLPITPMILRKMQQSWLDRNQCFNSIMWLSASLVTFFSFCWSGEITVEDENKYDPSVHLSFSDVAINNAESPNVISLNIKYSKIDQGAMGVHVILGRADNDLCPILALLVYLARRGNTPGALFQWDNRTTLSKTKL